MLKVEVILGIVASSIAITRVPRAGDRERPPGTAGAGAVAAGIAAPARNLSARVSYLIISTIVVIVAVMSVLNGIGLRRQGKRDEGTAWILASALAVIVRRRRLGRVPLLPLGQRAATCSSCASSARSSASAATASRRSPPGRARRRSRRRSRASASRWTSATGAGRGHDLERPGDQRGDAAGLRRRHAQLPRQRQGGAGALHRRRLDLLREGRRAARLPGLQERDGQVQERLRRAEPGADPPSGPERARPPARRLLDRRRRLPDQRPRLPAGVHARRSSASRSRPRTRSPRARRSSSRRPRRSRRSSARAARRRRSGSARAR